MKILTIRERIIHLESLRIVGRNENIDDKGKNNALRIVGRRILTIRERIIHLE